MQKWEYLEITMSSEGRKDWIWTDTSQTTKQVSVSARLTELGLQGWEVVAATPQNNNGTTTYYYYLLKRPRQ